MNDNPDMYRASLIRRPTLCK